jgi:hypothetical protein
MALDVMGQEKWMESMRELLSGSHPGVVTKEDLAHVESRLDDLLSMMDAIEQKLGLDPLAVDAARTSESDS